MLASDVILAARKQHGAFSQERHPDVLLLQRLSHIQRIVLLALATPLQDRLSTAVQIAATISDTLVAVDADGNALAAVDTGDGYAVGVDPSTDAPPLSTAPKYAALGSTAIATDPYSTGFPLPADASRILDIYAEVGGNVLRRVRWVPAIRRAELSGASDLLAIVNGWRLIPIKNPTNMGTLWDQVVTITVAWIETAVALSTTSAALVVPTVYADYFSYDLASYMAGREATENEKFAPLAQRFATDAQAAYQALLASAQQDHAPVRITQSLRAR